jgi:biopolymer transport protein ExbB
MRAGGDARRHGFQRKDALLMRSCFLIGAAVLVVCCAAALPAAAQATDEGEVAVAADPNYFDFFVVKGGYIAFGLILLSIVTIALTVEHCLSIRRATIVPAEAAERTKAMIDEKKYLDAVKYTADDPSMLGYVVNAGLVEASNGFTAMERALQESLEERAARLFRKTEYLHIIGNVSPMVGLFGTVTGMILLFAEIHASDAFPGARVVADRIAIALITTFWGLAVAIPALSIHAVFRNRIDVLTAECALVAERILAVFKPGATSQAPAQAKVEAAVSEGHAATP